MNTLDELRSGKLAGAKRLDLQCGLTELPSEVFDLADSLEVLNLTGNALRDLPDDLTRLKKLRILFCSSNRFTHLPPVLGHCEALSMVGFKSNQIAEVAADALSPNLRWLILTDNQIRKMPSTLGRCAGMQKLMLAGNRLTELPEEMAACTRLELLRLAANDLPGLPDWLLKMPRLAWLAFAGNPCSPSDQIPIPKVPDAIWDDLRIEEKLGEGASGEIYRATWNGEPVAVKLFKGAVASDGLPRYEMDASLAIGTHPHLIPVRARLKGHPEGIAGLVMSLIPPTYTSLAGPPSFETCTRDVYPVGSALTPKTSVRLALGIASAARHLHELGFSHGDLYAHNILLNDEGHGLLGDLGAASFYGVTRAPDPQALHRIEVRAFGFLLEELITQTSWAEADLDFRPALAGLQSDCEHPEVKNRPDFREVQDRLGQLYQP